MNEKWCSQSCKSLTGSSTDVLEALMCSLASVLSQLAGSCYKKRLCSVAIVCEVKACSKSTLSNVMIKFWLPKDPSNWNSTSNSSCLWWRWNEYSTLLVPKNVKVIYSKELIFFSKLVERTVRTSLKKQNVEFFHDGFKSCPTLAEVCANRVDCWET